MAKRVVVSIHYEHYYGGLMGQSGMTGHVVRNER